MAKKLKFMNQNVKGQATKNNHIVAFMVWLCITIFYCYQYILRALPNIIMPNLMEKYGIGATDFSNFAGIYYTGYVLVHIPMGILISRLGARIVLTLTITLTALGLAPLIYSDSWFFALTGRLVTGIGSSAAVVGALQLFRIFYPEKFSRMLGIMVCLSLVTVVYAGGPINRVILEVGVDRAINILLYSGILLAIFTFLIIPTEGDQVSNASITSDIKVSLGNPKILIGSLFAGMLVGPLEGFADAWGSAFISAVYDIEKAQADSISLAIFSGMCIGCIIIPYIAEKTRAYYGTTICCGAGITTCFTLMLTGLPNAPGLYYLCFLAGIFSAYQVVTIAIISSFVAVERSGVAAAVANMIVMAFGLIFHRIIGFTLDSSPANIIGSLPSGVKIYSADSYLSAISVIPIAAFIASIGFIIMAIKLQKTGQKFNS